MNNKIWYLSTCDTCKRIIKELDLKSRNNFEFQNIKKEIILKGDLEEIHNSTELNYEDLFNKRAQKYSKTDLKDSLKFEEDFKEAILSEYTFMKRPIIKINNEFFVGNSKVVVEKAKLKLQLTN